MDKDATKCNGSDKYKAPTNESAEKEESESISMEVKEIETTTSVISDDEPDNMHTESHESAASGRGTVVTTYLQYQERFQLPSYEAVQEINKLQPMQEARPRGGNKKNKNENIRLTETTGRSCQPTNLERHTFAVTQRRIDSFVNCSYQHQLPQAVALAEAGFYLTDNGVIQCFACGIEFSDWTEQDLVWEWHGRRTSFCPHVETEGKKYFGRQYLDLKNKKKQDIGDPREQLKECLLCKLCYVNISNLVLLPCGHVCLCMECVAKVTVCPTCDSHIFQHVQVSLDIEQCRMKL